MLVGGSKVVVAGDLLSPASPVVEPWSFAVMADTAGRSRPRDSTRPTRGAIQAESQAYVWIVPNSSASAPFSRTSRPWSDSAVRVTRVRIPNAVARIRLYFAKATQQS